MGRHEKFKDAAPIAEQLQAGTAINSSAAKGQGRDRDWDAMAAQHPGLIPYPLHAPRYLLAVDGVIQAEAVRLLELAEGELARRQRAYLSDVGRREWPEVEQYLRAEMRMDALEVVAKGLAEDTSASRASATDTSVEADAADPAGGRKSSGLPGEPPEFEISPEMKRMFRKFELSKSLMAKQMAGKISDFEERPVKAFNDVFYDVCRGPINDPHRFELMQRCIDWSMTMGREEEENKWGGTPFPGTVEDAIDRVLEHALEYTDQNFDTAILALVRYRIEKQRRQAANV